MVLWAHHFRFLLDGKAQAMHSSSGSESFCDSNRVFLRAQERWGCVFMLLAVISPGPKTEQAKVHSCPLPGLLPDTGVLLFRWGGLSDLHCCPSSCWIIGLIFNQLHQFNFLRSSSFAQVHFDQFKEALILILSRTLSNEEHFQEPGKY